MTLERAAARLLPRTRFRRGLRIVASLSLLVALLPGTGNADPASDALARLKNAQKKHGNRVSKLDNKLSVSFVFFFSVAEKGYRETLF